MYHDIEANTAKQRMQTSLIEDLECVLECVVEFI